MTPARHKNGYTRYRIAQGVLNIGTQGTLSRYAQRLVAPNNWDCI